MPWKHEIVDKRIHESHAILPPGGHMSPYIWRATLRDGSVIVRGDKIGGKGPTILCPQEVEKVRVGLLARVDLLPANQGEKWPPLSVAIKDGETLVYDSLLEVHEARTESGLDKPWTSFEGCASVRLGVVAGVSGFSGVVAHRDGRVNEFQECSIIGWPKAIEEDYSTRPEEPAK